MASEVPRSGVVAAVLATPKPSEGGSAAEPCSQKSGRTRTGVHGRLGGRAALAGERDRLGRWFWRLAETNFEFWLDFV